MSFYVYLSGEIHTDWREEIQRGAEAAGLDVVFTAPVTDHDASDAAGDHLGKPENGFWRDHQSSKVNAIRTRTLIEQGMPADQVFAAAFGDNQPVAPNNDADSRARNRRVELTTVPRQSEEADAP